MIVRTPISEQDWEQVLADLETKFRFRRKQKGDEAWVSSHEISGFITEEYNEMLKEVQDHNKSKLIEELKDIAVACIWGIASIQYGEAEVL